MKQALIITLLLFSTAGMAQKLSPKKISLIKGAVVRGDPCQKRISLVFTGDEFADGGAYIQKLLKKEKIKAAFFFTGNFYRNPKYNRLIKNLIRNGHYLGAHSNKHLLYCDWTNRDSLLVTQEEFNEDLLENYKEMAKFRIEKKDAPFFLPPYEWYNDSIAHWTHELGFTLINMTHGTLSHVDYTTPRDPNYKSSKDIFKSVINFEEGDKNGLNGFLLLMHIGTDPARTDKFYPFLEPLITTLKSRDYEFTILEHLLAQE